MSRETTPNVQTGTEDFDLAANAFLTNVREKVMTPANEQFSEGLSDKTPYHNLEVDAGRPLQFLRIWHRCGVSQHSLSCWAFVALNAGQNKKLGTWRRGDIFKPDGWKGPARTARGNIFEPGENGCCNIVTTHGPSYINGW